MNKKVDTLSKLEAVVIPTGQTPPEAKPTSRFAASGVGAFLDANAQKIRADNAERKLAELLDTSTGERTLYIDPNDVIVWSMHDRETKLAFSDDDPEWEEFKKTIEATGGNRESVKVREISPGKYELIAGRRRLQAVKEKRLRLKAEILPPTVGDRQAWIDMRVENEGGQPLSLVEKARSYYAALDSGLFTNQNDLSQAVGATKGDLSTLLSLARIPNEIINALGDWRALTRQQVRTLIDVHKQVGDDELTKRSLAIPVSADNLAAKVQWLKTGKIEAPLQVTSTRFKGGTLRIEDKKITLVFESPEQAKQVLEGVKALVQKSP
jgi:ParB/RepB/Spo0J family partition protein